MSGDWEIKGFVGSLETSVAAVEGASENAVLNVAEYILGESIAQVPHNKGDLQSSARVETEDGKPVAAVVYDTPYAARQHEEMGYRHSEGRKAKYLEDPLNETATSGAALKIIARELEKPFNG